MSETRVYVKLNDKRLLLLTDKSVTMANNRTAWLMRKTLLRRHSSWVETTKTGFWRKQIRYQKAKSPKQESAFGFAEYAEVSELLQFRGHRLADKIFIPISPQAKRMKKSPNLIEKLLSRKSKNIRYFLGRPHGSPYYGIWKHTRRGRGKNRKDKVELMFLMVKMTRYNRKYYKMEDLIPVTKKLQRIILTKELERHGFK